MSVFSVTAIDRLIESTDKGAPSRTSANEKGPVREKRPLYSYSAYSPGAINTTRPRSPSPSSFSSSPFIVNFKGRRAIRQEVQKPSLEHGVQSGSAERLDMERDPIGRKLKVTPAESNQNENGNEGVYSQMNKLDNDAVKIESGCMKSHSRRSPGNLSIEKDFFKIGRIQPFEYPMQVTKSDEGASDSTASGDEFFDAPESPASGSSTGDELPYEGQLSRTHSNCTRATNLSNLDELEADVERLTPSHNEIVGRSSTDLLDLPDQIIQKIEIARLVACAVARGAAKADAEEELAMITDIKNREISRLRDKLHYYETINHEMSQRNQECTEIARRRRRERQRRLRLTIGCLAVTACLSMSATALYRYFPWEDFKAWRMSSDSIELGENTVGDD